jgi:hypothetical protein
MPDPANIIVFDCIVSGLIALDLVWVLARGCARSWSGSRITRQQQPEQYRRYLFESAGMIAACLAVFACATFSPDSPSYSKIGAASAVAAQAGGTYSEGAK